MIAFLSVIRLSRGTRGVPAQQSTYGKPCCQRKLSLKDTSMKRIRE